jgi:prolyl oligopeptidase
MRYAVAVAFLLHTNALLIAAPPAKPPAKALLARKSDSAKPPYPATQKRPVAETYGPMVFQDDYQWLEDAADPTVRSWVEGQNRLTRSILDAVPARDSIARRLTALYKAPRLSYYGVVERGKKLFGMKSEPPREQPLLVVFDSPADAKSERVLFDPNAADAKGSMAIDFYVPSLDGKRVAISLSRNGSEDGSVHVIEVSTGRETGDVIPRVNFATAGGSVAWNADGTGFWYTRYPHAGERPKEDADFYQQIWFHTVGRPESSDVYTLGKEFPRIAEIELESSDDGAALLAVVKNGDGGEIEHWIRKADDTWVQVTRFADRISQAHFGGDGALYLLSHGGAPNGKLLRLALDDPKFAAAAVVIPEGTESIDSFAAGKNALYLSTIAGGPSELLAFDRSGKAIGPIPIPPISAVYDLVRIGDDDFLFRTGSYTAPATWFRYDALSRATSPAVLRAVSPVNFGDATVVREFATSKDGTKVPINIIYRKGTKLDGKNPTILSGYGGYAISVRPGMSLSARLWLDAGGIIAVANLRGGGEYGEGWHEAGKMLRKQNVFDDFAACAQHLVARRYTSVAKLAIQGGSNGGLLMGVEITQHPELFRAVVSHVGLYDMPRELRTPNGVFNVTEFGSPDDPVQLRAIMAYSPYHHVVEGTRYPAVLLLTGDNDGRVDPMNSRKFLARLQAATGSADPILLRTTSTSGHGIGTALSDSIASTTDVYAFLWRELGLAAPAGAK